mgnify:CR=1 FL=1
MTAPATPATVRPEARLLRWFGSYGTFAVPQAAAPIAFSLIALPLTGSASAGAAMMLAMTIAQVLGAVPLSRLGRRFAPVPFVRALIGLRTLALIAIAVLAGLGAPFALVVAGAALAGLVNGAAYGTLRAVLNHLVPASRLPRSLGIAATLNEVTFVASPVIAASLGGISPQLAAWAMVVLGAAPLLLLPSIPSATAPGPEQRGSALRLSPMIVLWLVCGGASAASIAAIEIGRPRIEPELSISSVTTVSRNSVSFSTLNDSGVVGFATTRARRPASRTPSSLSNSQLRLCCACRRRCSLLASRLTAPRRGSSCLSR